MAIATTHYPQPNRRYLYLPDLPPLASHYFGRPALHPSKQPLKLLALTVDANHLCTCDLLGRKAWKDQRPADGNGPARLHSAHLGTRVMPQSTHLERSASS